MSEITRRDIKANGIRMHVAEAGEGPLVVMLHGFPEGWYSWRHQLAALSEAGFHAVAPDQRGYGRTDRPPEVEKYSMMHLVGDVIGLLDALEESQAVVVGHDCGAPVAWNTALWRPDRVSGVVGLSVPFRRRGRRPPLDVYREVLGERFYQIYFQEPGVAERDLEADVRHTLLQVLWGASGEAPSVYDGMVQEEGLVASFGAPDRLPAWLREGDLDNFVKQFESTSLPWWQGGRQQPEDGCAQPQADRGALRLRSLDPTGATGGGQLDAAGVRAGPVNAVLDPEVVLRSDFGARRAKVPRMIRDAADVAGQALF